MLNSAKLRNAQTMGSGTGSGVNSPPPGRVTSPKISPRANHPNPYPLNNNNNNNINSNNSHPTSRRPLLDAARSLLHHFDLSAPRNTRTPHSGVIHHSGTGRQTVGPNNNSNSNNTHKNYPSSDRSTPHHRHDVDYNRNHQSQMLPTPDPRRYVYPSFPPQERLQTNPLRPDVSLDAYRSQLASSHHQTYLQERQSSRLSYADQQVQSDRFPQYNRNIHPDAYNRQTQIQTTVSGTRYAAPAPDSRFEPIGYYQEELGGQSRESHQNTSSRRPRELMLHPDAQLLADGYGSNGSAGVRKVDTMGYDRNGRLVVDTRDGGVMMNRSGQVYQSDANSRISPHSVIYSGTDDSGSRRPSIDGLTYERRPSFDSLNSERNPSSDGLIFTERRPSFEGLMAERQPSFDGLMNERRPSLEGLMTERRPSFDGLMAVRRPSFDTLMTEERPSFDGLIMVERHTSYDSLLAERRPSFDGLMGERRSSLDGLISSDTSELNSAKLRLLSFQNQLSGSVGGNEVDQDRYFEQGGLPSPTRSPPNDFGAVGSRVTRPGVSPPHASGWR